MITATDLDALLQLVRWYYPPGVDADDPRYLESTQAKRLRSLLGGVARDVGDITEYAANHPPVPDEVLELGTTVRHRQHRARTRRPVYLTPHNHQCT